MGAALGMAAIVLDHHNDAGDWINAGMLLVEWVCFGDPEQGIDGYNLIDADGGYAEGTHYMHYSWKKAAPFFVAMKNFNGDWTETYSSSNISGFYPAYGTANNLTLQNPFFDPRFTSIFEWAMKIRLPDGTLPVMEDSLIQLDFSFELYGEIISFNGDVDLGPYAGSANVIMASGWLDTYMLLTPMWVFIFIKFTQKDFHKPGK